MINVLSGLKLGRARNVTSWEEVLQLFRNRRWTKVPTAHGRMAFAVEDGNLLTGRMLALVMMEDCQTPEVGFPIGTMMLGLHGELTTQDNNGETVVMGPWDLVSLDGGSQAPFSRGLYLGLWNFPEGNTLLRIVEAGARH